MTWTRSLPRSPSPSSATGRTDRASHGVALVATARSLGVRLLPWQRLVVDVALEHVGGRLCYRDVAVSVPRQSGKTTLLLTLLVHRMLSADRQRLSYTAQTRLAARAKLLDTWWPQIAASPLRGRFSVTRGMGSESLRSANGSVLTILSTDEAAGHGDVLDLAILDEAWALDARAEQATRPAMATRPNAQLWLASTAGTDRSMWWRQKVDGGRATVDAGVTEGSAFFEWAAHPDADIGDPATWWSCMPALGHTVEEATIAADLRAMHPAEFRRAYGNQWPDEAAEGWAVISRDAWMAARL
jgi:phage terminase large subunit-like protein